MAKVTSNRPSGQAVKKRTATRKQAGTKRARTRQHIAREILQASEDQHRQIEECAYLKAEKDGFHGSPVDYWLAAEKELVSATG